MRLGGFNTAVPLHAHTHTLKEKAIHTHTLIHILTRVHKCSNTPLHLYQSEETHAHTDPRRLVQINCFHVVEGLS